jgi:hypothetical protein
MKNKKYFGYVFLGIILILEYLKVIFTQQVNADGIWSLSQTISMVNGDFGWSKFSHELDGQIYYNFLYSIFFYVPFKIFGVSFIVYVTSYFFYILLAIIAFYQIFNNRDYLGFLFGLSLATSVYTFNFRFELFGILLISWGFYFLLRTSKWKNVSWLFFAWAGLLHPATLVAIFFLFLLYFYYEKKLSNFKVLGISALFFLFFFFLLIGFNINHYLEPIFIRPELKQRFMVIKPENFFKWLALSGTIIFVFVGAFKRILWFPMLFILGNILVYLIFKKSYYYPYLILHLLVIFYYNRDIKYNKFLRTSILTVAMLFVILFTCLPFYKIRENPEYYYVVHYNIDYLKNKTDLIRSTNAKIYVERDLAFGIFDYYYGRMYMYEYQDYFAKNPKIDLMPEDKIYIFHKEELDKLKADPSFALVNSNIEIREIQRPVKGILTLGESRSDSIGFWEIGLKK